MHDIDEDNEKTTCIHWDEQMNTRYILDNDDVDIIDVIKLGDDSGRYHDGERNEYDEGNINRYTHRYLRRNELNEHLNDNEEKRCFDTFLNDENENESDNGL